MKRFKISKAVPWDDTIKKLAKASPMSTGRRAAEPSPMNKTFKSVAQEKRAVSNKQAKRKNNSMFEESPMNEALNKFDNYFRFIKDQKIKLGTHRTSLWNRAVKTPLPMNYIAPKLDDRRRSVMEDRRSRRASQSPYLQEQRQKEAKKKLLVEGRIINKRRSSTPRSKDKINTAKQDKPNIQALEQKAQKEMFEGIEFFRDLGRGAHALVRSAVDWKHNRKIAVKVYRKNDLTEQELGNIEREVEILQQIDHPGIAMLYDIIETPQTINLVMEYGGGNSLHQYLRSRPDGRFQEGEAKILFRQILDAIGYLHRKNIVHRDIKPENILLNKTMKVKIIDFGFSLICKPLVDTASVHDRVVTFCGTPTYMAPEIVNKRDHIGMYADRWSLGVLLYTMLQGIYPFRANSQKELFKKISKGVVEYITEVSDNARLLIQRFLRLSPWQRISPQEALQDRWFRQ